MVREGAGKGKERRKGTKKHIAFLLQTGHYSGQFTCVILKSNFKAAFTYQDVYESHSSVKIYKGNLN